MWIVGVQLNMAWEDKPKNHQRVRELLEASPPIPDSLVILPEMFETGFTMNVSAASQGDSREGEKLLKDLAKTYGVAVMGGVANALDAEAGRNEAVAFAPDGTELVRYQKQQPFTLSGEDKCYPAGTEHKIFEWQGVKIAPYICYDLRFPERFRAAIAEGAELITLIACWPSKRSEHWVRLLQARAIENLAAVVGVNRCGNEPGLEFDGRSCAFDHMGQTIYEADSAEQVFTVEFDVASLREWRDSFPALRDMQEFAQA